MDSAAQGGAGIGQHLFSGVGEERQIGCAVADVREAVISEAGMKESELLASSKVCSAVAAEYAGEYSEVISDALGKADVRSGSEVELAAASVFLLEEVKNLAVVGQVGDVELNVRGDEGFESGFTVQQGARKLKEAARMVAGEDEERVDEGVGLDERAI